jgi:hypothetical protein
MTGHRNRIERLSSAAHGLHLLPWREVNLAKVLGYIQRGHEQGRLLLLSSGNYVMQMPGGSIKTLDQRKVAAMLEQENDNE